MLKRRGIKETKVERKEEHRGKALEERGIRKRIRLLNPTQRVEQDFSFILSTGLNS